VLVLIGLVVGAGIGVDLWTKQRAIDQLTSAARSSLQANAVAVTIDDFPFLLSLQRDRLESGTLRASQAVIPVQNRKLPVSDLRLTVKGVGPVKDLNHAVIDKANATAVISWTDLSDLLGVRVDSGGGDRVQVNTTVTVLDRPVSVAVSGVPSFDSASKQITLVNALAEVAGVQVPDRVTQAAIKQASNLFKLPTVAGLSWESLTVSGPGATVGLSATKLVLAKLG